MLALCGLLVAFPLLVLANLPDWIAEGAKKVTAMLSRRRERNRARVEAELDRTQAELRQTILRLATELGGDALEARKALIRESFLARGEIPPR